MQSAVLKIRSEPQLFELLIDISIALFYFPAKKVRTSIASVQSWLTCHFQQAMGRIEYSRSDPLLSCPVSIERESLTTIEVHPMLDQDLLPCEFRIVASCQTRSSLRWSMNKCMQKCHVGLLSQHHLLLANSCSRKRCRWCCHRSSCSRSRSPLILLLLRLHVQPTQISLPPNSNHSRKHTPVLRCNKGKAECRDSRPQLPAVPPADGHRIDNSLLRLRERLSRQETLHAEEICVEARCEEGLVDDDLGRNRQCMRLVVEMVAQKHEPLVVRYRRYTTNDQRSQTSRRVVGFLAGYFLSRQIAQEIDDQCCRQLCHVWRAMLHATICSERLFQWLNPCHSRSGDCCWP
jgi:hypothetical protein